MAWAYLILIQSWLYLSKQAKNSFDLEVYLPKQAKLAFYLKVYIEKGAIFRFYLE